MPVPASGQPGVYDILAFGASSGSDTPATEAVQGAIDACHEAGGGTVLVPPGVFTIGTIFLKSHVTLYLSAGAVLRGSGRREDYNPDDIFPENPVFSQENVTGAHLVIAYCAEHVTIAGDGTIDGNSGAFFSELPPEETVTSYMDKKKNLPIHSPRPGQMVFFCRCRNVAVRDVSLINSTYWTLFFLGCENVRVRGLRITNPPQTQNGDGIDIDCCRDVTVSDCIISSGDDAITLRGANRLLGENSQPCEHVAVSNCVISSPCTAIRVGVGDGIVRHCSFSNIIVKEARTGINFISAYSERAAHGVSIEDIHFADFFMNTHVPLNILPGQTAKPPACINDISFAHFRMTGTEGCYIGGNEDLPIQGVRLHDVVLRLTGGEGDVDPDFAQKTPKPFGRNGAPAGLFLRCARQVRVSEMRIEWHEINGPWQNAVVLDRCADIVLSGLEAPPPPVATAGEALRCIKVTGLRQRDI